MVLWVFVLFLVGIFALLINILDIFPWFVMWWPVILMLIAFGMLIRLIWEGKKFANRKVS